MSQLFHRHSNVYSRLSILAVPVVIGAIGVIAFGIDLYPDNRHGVGHRHRRRVLGVGQQRSGWVQDGRLGVAMVTHRGRDPGRVTTRELATPHHEVEGVGVDGPLLHRL